MMLLSLFAAITAFSAGIPPDKVVMTGRSGENYQIMGIFEKHEKECADRPIYFKEVSSGYAQLPDMILFWSEKDSRWALAITQFASVIIDREANLEELPQMAFAEGNVSDPALVKNWHIWEGDKKDYTLDENVQCLSFAAITKNSDAIVIYDWFWPQYKDYEVNGVYYRQEDVLANEHPIWVKAFDEKDKQEQWIIRAIEYGWCVDRVQNLDPDTINSPICNTFGSDRTNWELGGTPYDYTTGDFHPTGHNYHLQNKTLRMRHFAQSAEPEPPIPKPTAVPTSEPEPVPTPKPAPVLPTEPCKPVVDWKNTLPCGSWIHHAENPVIQDGILTASFEDPSSDHKQKHTIQLSVIPGVCYEFKADHLTHDNVGLKIEDWCEPEGLQYFEKAPRGSWYHDAFNPTIVDGVLTGEFLPEGFSAMNAFMQGQMLQNPTIKLTPGVEYKTDGTAFLIEKLHEDVEGQVFPGGDWYEAARSPRVENGVLYAQLLAMGIPPSFKNAQIEITPGAEYSNVNGQFVVMGGMPPNGIFPGFGGDQGGFQGGFPGFGGNQGGLPGFGGNQGGFPGFGGNQGGFPGFGGNQGGFPGFGDNQGGFPAFGGGQSSGFGGFPFEMGEGGEKESNTSASSESEKSSLPLILSCASIGISLIAFIISIYAIQKKKDVDPAMERLLG